MKINNVKIRMYSLGTGDCFILKFCEAENEKFTMMIDCGSCQGKPDEIRPYLEKLAEDVNNKIDLLVITHEHQDHVNGFAKCPDIFENFTIGQAWFAWTEDPTDPTGAAKELQKKRSRMKLAFQNALSAIEKNVNMLENSDSDEFYTKALVEEGHGYLRGLHTLAEINLPAANEAGKPLPGMTKIKEFLKNEKVKIRYLNPGDTLRMAGTKGFRFHVLGPPLLRKYIFKNGKEGVDVFNKKIALNESSLAANAFVNMASNFAGDVPFASHFVINESKTPTPPVEMQKVVNSYKDPDNDWRTIDNDWLNSAGSLALRLNSHINNTSLAFAIEFDDSKKVLLFPGDAEFGSWESWHEIEKWKPKKENDKHFVEDLLNRTVFYKVGHHLSFNGTALQKGISMMESNEMAAMATLDRRRISKVWKSTMPNKYLMQELAKKCEGKLFIMDEFEINDPPSKQLDPTTLTEDYLEGKADDGEVLYKQYTVRL